MFADVISGINSASWAQPSPRSQLRSISIMLMVVAWRSRSIRYQDLPEKDAMFVKVISGGQTGVDRAALDLALALHFPCGGWCPRGRRAEDGSVPDRYPLSETPSADYPQR